MKNQIENLLWIDFSKAPEKIRSIQKIFDTEGGHREQLLLEATEHLFKKISGPSHGSPEKIIDWLVLVEKPAFGLPADKARKLDGAGSIYVTHDSGHSYFET